MFTSKGIIWIMFLWEQISKFVVCIVYNFVKQVFAQKIVMFFDKFHVQNFTCCKVIHIWIYN